MPNHIALTTYLVRDYDEAISWFRSVLNFKLFENSNLSATKRWVVMGPDTPHGARFLFAKADDDAQRAQVGKAAGGRVAYFLYTDDFVQEFERRKSIGLNFVEAPRNESYGTVAVFEDLYGNRWDMIQPTFK